MGYAKERVTCYMDAAAYHIPNIVTQKGKLKQFSSQGKLINGDFEKNLEQH